MKVIMCVVVFVLAACGNSEKPAQQPSAQPEPTKITEVNALAEVTGPDGTAGDGEAVGVLGSMGSFDGEGMGGFGLTGGGTGAGGVGTIGSGSYGTLGTGSGPAPSAGTPAATSATPEVVGDLDKNIIRRYMRRSLAKLQKCYEAELVNDPKLRGTVTVSYEILASGAVHPALTTTQPKAMDAVGTCVAHVVSQQLYPKPVGGTSVRVRYPLTFTAP